MIDTRVINIIIVVINVKVVINVILLTNVIVNSIIGKLGVSHLISN